MSDLLLVLTLPEAIRNRYAEAMRAVSPDLRVSVADHHSRVDPFIAQAEILVTFGPMMTDDVFAKAGNLKWVQALGSGIDGITDQPSLKPGTRVTNMRGIHGAAVAEAALGAMLALARNLPSVVRQQGRHAWERRPASLLDGKVLVIVGIGVIAEALAPRAQALGMRVIGVSSAPRPLPGFDAVVARTALHEALAQGDHVVLLAPHTPQTHHMIDAAALGAMKPSAFLTNLARGGVVDEPALLRALRERRLGGAALDVFDTEPLPADHPFWDMETVLITPHLGGFFDEYPDRALPVVTENIRRYLAGRYDDMINRVDWEQAP